MASNGFLIGAILVALVVVLLARLLAWRLIVGVISASPAYMTRLSGSAVWARAAPLKVRLAARFPGPFHFIAARVSLQRFVGLPLTLVVLSAVYAVLALAGLIDDVHETEGVVRFDEGVNAFFAPYRAAWLLKVFLWITALGAGPALAAFVGTTTALLWSGGRRQLVPPLWVTFAGAQATTWTSKYVIGRPRPAFLPSVTEWNPSFPSGHATATTALIGFLGYVVARGLTGRRERFEAAFWTVTLIALICFSRIFLSLHFLSDVLAGVTVGVFWWLVGFTLAELRHPRPVQVLNGIPRPITPPNAGTPSSA